MKPIRFCLFTCRQSPDEGNMAARTIMHHHPEATIVHMTDQLTPAARWADECWRWEWNGSQDTLFLVRAHHMANFDDQPTVSLDTDTLVCARLDEAFSEPMDAGLTQRHEQVLRYNGGVMFSSGPAFWKAIYERMLKAPHKHFMMSEDALVKEVGTAKWKIRNLPCKEWNNYYLDLTSTPKIKVLHYKGNRKEWQRKHFDEGVWKAAA